MRNVELITVIAIASVAMENIRPPTAVHNPKNPFVRFIFFFVEITEDCSEILFREIRKMEGNLHHVLPSALLDAQRRKRARFEKERGPEARNHAEAEAIAQIPGQNTVGLLDAPKTRNSNNPNVHLFNYEEHNNDILDVVSTPQERQEARDRLFGAAGRMASFSSTDDFVHIVLRKIRRNSAVRKSMNVGRPQGNRCERHDPLFRCILRLRRHH
uniref:Uncharacterized protein n=1 Tax=Bursaphelenchus xylophilus TaxID=6326 RepID=A0A1I7SVL6_BURXY